MRSRRFIVALVLTGGLLAACLFVWRPDAVLWRAQFVSRKLAGDLPGVGWPELGVTIAPGFLNVRSIFDPGISPFAQSLDVPMHHAEDWKMFSMFFGRTRCLESLDVHLSVLGAGKTPHAPHTHSAEELIIPVRGNLSVIRALDADGSGQSQEEIGPGKFLYHAANDFHTLRAPATAPASYLVFKWDSKTKPEDDATGLRSSTFDYAAAVFVADGNETGWARTALFHSRTAHLPLLHSHLSKLEPGAGYAPHTDNYDIGIFLASGTVETIGQRVTAPSVIFYAAGRPHGIRNVADTPAEYLVFEFHGCGGSE